MEVLHPRCAGLDVHKKSVMACIITPEGREVREFGAMTRDLLALADWLLERQVTQVAMESTGVYWKPVYNLLEPLDITVLVVNAQHIKAVPGRKTDVKDAEWIADLVRHGLVRGSYIPDRGQRELRELVRTRRTLIGERSRVVRRIQQVLEGANIKLSAVATDVLGKSGREMLEALVAGIVEPAALAELARGKLRKKQGALKEALEGLVGPHQRLLLAHHLRHIEFLDDEIAQLSQEVEERMRPFKEELALLDEITGVGPRVAEEVIAEIGVDMSRFPTEGHLASWAKVCPGNNESAGKHKSGRTGQGNPWLRSGLVEAARAAARNKRSYLAAQYRRIAARRGANRAAMAVAHTILGIIYQLLSRHCHYQDLGADYFDQREQDATVRRLTRRLERLGYEVAPKPV